MKKTTSPKGFAKRFVKDERGGILIIFGLSIVFLTAIGGAAVDLGQQQLMRLKLQNSVDAAVTSAGSLISCHELITPAIRSQAAQRYFALNYPERFADNTKRPPLTITRSDDQEIAAESNDDLKTYFVSNFAIPTLAAEARSGAAVTDRRMDTNFDTVMVIDETGSMRNGLGYFPFMTAEPPYPPYEQSRAAAAERAFRTFAANLFPDCEVPNPNVRIGMAGFAGYVTNKWALSSDRTYALGLSSNIHPVGRNIEEIGMRAGMNILLGQPGADKEISTWNASTASKDDWYGGGPTSNGYPAGYKVPFALQGVSERRGTLRPLPGSFNQNYTGAGFLDLSIDYDTRVPLPATARTKPEPEFRHLILMSDGTIATDASTGFRNTSALIAECNRAKAAGITVHTINFTSQASSDVTVLTSCASSPANYHFAPTEDDLKKILVQIGSTIYRTRIVQ